jgi:hypothetical protein
VLIFQRFVISLPINIEKLTNSFSGGFERNVLIYLISYVIKLLVMSQRYTVTSSRPLPPKTMSEDARSSVSRARRPLRVINRGPDSDDSEDDNNLCQYTVYPNPASQAHYHIPLGASTYSPSILQPSRLSTDNSTNYQSSSRSNPTLSSPSSTSSHAVESTPPPTTPSLSTPPADDPPPSQESSVTPSSGDRIEPSHSHSGGNTHTLKLPYHSHRNGVPLPPRPPANPSPTFRPVPVSIAPLPLFLDSLIFPVSNNFHPRSIHLSNDFSLCLFTRQTSHRRHCRFRTISHRRYHWRKESSLH